ncbi:Leucine-rich repeat [Trinorchestia longiramus]|nr:Leucine-rich repeat [Trinorchestia longiramus]
MDNRIEVLRHDAFRGLRYLQSVSLHGNPIHRVHPKALTALPALNSIILQEVSELRNFPDLTGTSSLETVRFDRSSLTHVPHNLCSLVPNLKSLNLHRNALESLPRLALCVELRLLDLSHNRISALSGNQFVSQQNLQDLLLQQNRITVLEDEVFNGLTGLQTLNLEFNQITTIGPKTFLPLLHLKDINLGNNDLREFPEKGLEHVITLKVHHNRHLRVFPGPERFPAAHTLVLSYAYHCCAFLRYFLLHVLPSSGTSFFRCSLLQVLPSSGTPLCAFFSYSLLQVLHWVPSSGTPLYAFLRYSTVCLPQVLHCVPSSGTPLCAFLRDENHDDASEEAPKYIEDVIYNVEDIQDFDNTLLLNMSDIWSGMGKSDRPSAPTPPKLHLSAIQQNHIEKSSSAAPNDLPLTTDSAFVPGVADEDFGALWNKLAEDFTPEVAAAGASDSVALTTPQSIGPRAPILCIPKPGPFMPCRDLFDWWTLRCGVWIVFLLALLGNGTVVVVLSFARSKLDVPRFLVANLALADFFMGIYLGFLAVVDASTLGEFRMYAIPWQMSTGCQAAGFIGVLSSELSVYTLTVITLERNYAITHAMHLNKRLSLRHAAYVMLGGWVFAGTMAALPLIGISDYPPIAFFSLTAAFGFHLITLEEAKVFTVFVFPFNSCCNPFLYALLTKQFKKDCVTLCKTIEESRVTRGIGRCRHSSNFSNRQTPAHTNSAVEQSTKSNGDDCNCQSKKQPPPNFSQRVRISILKFFYCHHRQSKRNMNNEFNNEQNKLTNKNFRNTSMSSDAYSSSYSDNWRRGKMPLSLRLLDRRRHSSWYLTRKPSQESNLSSSRNDSSATTASTSTWRISRSSVSSDISSGASRVLGKNDSQMSLKLGSFRERRADSRTGMNSTVMVLQHAPKNGNSFKRPKPKLQRQTAVERETYLSNNLACDAIGGSKAVTRDNLSCVYEQDSFEEEDMAQVTAFLTPTYRLAGLAVGFIPRKLSTISSQSVSVNKDLDTEASPEDSSPDERLFVTEDDKNGDVENGLPLGTEFNSTCGKFPATPKERLRSRHLRSRRYPSDSNLRRRCDSPSHRYLEGDYIRRVATMPVILSPPESSSRALDVSPPADEDDVFLHPAAPEGLLETHFPLEEPPNEGDPLL